MDVAADRVAARSRVDAERGPCGEAFDKGSTIPFDTVQALKAVSSRVNRPDQRC